MLYQESLVTHEYQISLQKSYNNKGLIVIKPVELPRVLERVAPSLKMITKVKLKPRRLPLMTEKAATL